MSNELSVRQRRRAAVSCTECRRNKKRCDRKLPCQLCVLRKTESACKYDESSFPTVNASTSTRRPNPIRHASDSRTSNHGSDLPFSDNDGSLTSMGLLRQVVPGVKENGSNVITPARVYSQSRKLESDLYFNYVRRIPPRTHCELLFQHYFAGPNNLHCAIDEEIFREQLDEWWILAYRLLPTRGALDFPKEIRCFPAVIYQILAMAVQSLPIVHNVPLDKLLFGSAQTVDSLSEEWAGCGAAIVELLGKDDVTFLTIEHSLLYDIWLCNTGDLVQCWEHSGKTVRLAISLGLHLEPEVPPSSRAEDLLHTLWTNEQRKRVWLNLFVWDTPMAMVFGRTSFIPEKEVSVTPPLDCSIPKDRLHRVPVGRTEADGPNPMTERLLRYHMTLRIGEVRALETQGSIPRNPEKVRELHRFAVDFRKNLPPFFQRIPDTRWDIELPFVPVQRELLVYLVESFLIALHRPYITTREQSQRQIFASALTILDSQERLDELVARSGRMSFAVGVVFPTFDAAMMLAVILVLNPGRYLTSFQRPYRSLIRAVERLKALGSTMALARSGAEVLEASIRRVVEAHERSGGSPIPADAELASPQLQVPPSESSLSTPGDEQWRFELDHTIMDWNKQNSELDFNFADIQVPMPLKELVLDEALMFQGNNDMDLTMWATSQQQGVSDVLVQNQPAMMDAGENALWLFMTDTS